MECCCRILNFVQNKYPKNSHFSLDNIVHLKIAKVQSPEF